ACTEGRRLSVGRLHQRLVVQWLHHGFALGAGAVHRGTADHLGRLAYRRGRHLFDRLGARLVIVVFFFIDGRRRHRTGGGLAHHGRRQIVILVLIEGGHGGGTAGFRLMGLVVAQLG